MARSLIVALASVASAAITVFSPGAAESMDVAPLSAEQSQVLARVRVYATHYVTSLPNFLCEQVTFQFEAGKKGKRWHKGDTLTSKLAFNAGREQRKLELVNDKPAAGQKRWSHPLDTEGEFGSLMEAVFNPDSSTVFTWEGWQQIREHRLAVFNYAIDREHSKLTLGLSDIAKATLPFHGSIFADENSGAIWRITNVPEDIPKELETESIVTTIDYDSVSIGNQMYLLPSRAVVDMLTPSHRVRNELEFRNYRKFEAESTITFGSESPQPPDSGQEPPPR